MKTKASIMEMIMGKISRTYKLDLIEHNAADKKGGLYLLLGIAGLTAIAGLITDWNKTHLFNSKWSAHAKFHDAMTIFLGTTLGISGAFLLKKKTGDRLLQLQLGALLPALYWSSMAAAFIFPETKGKEAEFPEKVWKIGRFWLNEGPASTVILTLTTLGYFLEKPMRTTAINKLILN